LSHVSSPSQLLISFSLLWHIHGFCLFIPFVILLACTVNFPPSLGTTYSGRTSTLVRMRYPFSVLPVLPCLNNYLVMLRPGQPAHCWMPAPVPVLDTPTVPKQMLSIEYVNMCSWEQEYMKSIFAFFKG
jgi:hypothetical protein